MIRATDGQLERIKSDAVPEDTKKWKEMDVWARAEMLPAKGIEHVEGIVALQADFYRRKAGFQKSLQVRNDHRRRNILEVRGFG